MKKLVLTAVTALALVAAAPASAQPGNNNGCGEVISGLAAPGYGQAVADAARQGGFDDYIHLVCNHNG